MIGSPKRYTPDSRSDKRKFTRTAEKVHSVNFMYVRPTRGGRRM